MGTSISDIVKIDDNIYANYIVGFVDLLGQREGFKGQGLIPDADNEKETALFHAKTKDTTGAIKSLWSLDEMINNARILSQKNALNFKTTLPIEQQNEFNALVKYKISKQYWSDGIVYFTSLGDPEVSVPMNAINSIVLMLGAICFNQLAMQRPIRGGVEISWATELKHGELYGCGLAKAYELESEKAQYPRIVLGDLIMKYLHTISQFPQNTKHNEFSSLLANQCLKMIKIDCDGYPIIHYLSEYFQNNCLPDNAVAYKKNFVDNYTKALNFIQDSIDEHGKNKIQNLSYDIILSSSIFFHISLIKLINLEYLIPCFRINLIPSFHSASPFSAFP
jgi:hypothetical protein